MHDIWNPWHGCIKCSEGCQNCYMYALDRKRGMDGRDIFRTKAGFTYPLHQDRKGRYTVQSGEMLRVCMTSDFFLEQADAWRDEAWRLIRQRRDVKFFLLTKRPERVSTCLPSDWNDGWDHVMFNVTCENQKRADQRIPLLLDLPFKHKGIMCAPLLGPIDISDYLATNQIEQVLVGGENYDNPRPCDIDWVKGLHQACVQSDITFCFIETGTYLIKDGKTYHLKSKRLQSSMACKSGLQHVGKPMHFDLVDEYGPIEKELLYKPHFRTCCEQCGSRLICNGCSACSTCMQERGGIAATSE